MAETFDLLIVGGGINGAGIARDAAGRGLSVVLCEKDDLGSATSSASTKLIHGGLRYLEQLQFRLVREALAEREILMRSAPHLVQPLQFVLPHNGSLRPAWMVRLGLLLYDHLGGRRSLPGTESVKLNADARGGPLKEKYAKGFAYTDCRVDDARLVMLNAIDAADRGARILTRTSCTAARPNGGLWHATLSDAQTGTVREVTARMVVNAAGPWVEDVLSGLLGVNATRGNRLVKGSHIVIPRLFEGEHAYIFQHVDGRVIFAIPYEGSFTLIGTTDVPFDGTPGPMEINRSEIEYLCVAINAYMVASISPADVVWSYSGLRSLYDDGEDDPSTVTRDYRLEVGHTLGSPILSIFGGKITTYRRLAEAALEKIAIGLGRSVRRPWTADTPLPGGDLGANFDTFAAELTAAYGGLDAGYLRGLARRHGTRVYDLLGPAGSPEALGQDFGGGLFEREVVFLLDHEWAMTATDILWRRTKCGLHGADAEALGTFIQARRSSAA